MHTNCASILSKYKQLCPQFKFTYFAPTTSQQAAATRAAATHTHTTHQTTTKTLPPPGPCKTNLVLHPHPGSWLELQGKNLGAQLVMF